MPDGGITMVGGQYLLNVAIKRDKKICTPAKCRYHQANANWALAHQAKDHPGLISPMELSF